MNSTTTSGVAPVGSIASPMLGKFRSMLGWRLLAMAATAGGSIWAARCLGPDNLGKSAAVQAVAVQIMLFAQFGQNQFLIRRYKHLPDPAAKRELVEDVVTVRMAASLFWAVLGFIVFAFLGFPAAWALPVCAGIVLFVLEAQTIDWLLQAQENQPAIYRTALWGALLMSVCYFAFFRPGVSAGANLVVACGGALLVQVMTYRIALQGMGKINPGVRHLRRGLRLLWEGRVFFATMAVITVYTQGEQLVVTWFRPIEELGIYKSALQITGGAIPLFTIITSLLYPRFIEWQKQGAGYLWRQQLRLGKLAALAWCLGAIVIVPGVPLVYPFLFGPQFAGGALPCVFLLLSKMLVIIVSIFTFGLWAHGRDKLMLAATTLAAVVSMGGNLLLIPRYGIVAAAMMNLAAEAVMLALGIFLSFRLSRQIPA